MGAVDRSSETPAANIRGGLVSGPNPAGARDAYEAGTVTGVSATGRYKAFATPFSARPSVVVSAIRSAGSAFTPYLFGTANVGSFHVRMDRVGSTMVQFIAVGQR